MAELYFQALNVYVDPELTPIGTDNLFLASRLSLTGRGFLNPFVTTPVAPKGTAMELGPLGLDAMGLTSLRVPQVYCSGDQSNFARNVPLAPVPTARAFQPLEGALAPTSSDPFPMP